jgi:hypothetical protein
MSKATQTLVALGLLAALAACAPPVEEVVVVEEVVTVEPTDTGPYK